MKDGIISLMIGFAVDYYCFDFFNLFKKICLEKGTNEAVIDKQILVIQFATILLVTVIVYIIIGLIKWIFYEREYRSNNNWR